jgi:UDP-N-acetylglucosamine acyltransferase
LRIGAHAFIGGLTAVTSDVIPFGMAIGNRAFLAGLNITGLKRRGFDRTTIFALRDAYREMFHGAGNRHQRIDKIAKRHADVPAVQEMVTFLRDSGERRLCLPRKQSSAARRMMEDDTVDA